MVRPRKISPPRVIQPRPAAPAEAWRSDGLPDGPVQLVVSLPDQRLTVYQGGAEVVTTEISSGRPGYDTPAGVFSILDKRRTYFSRTYDDAPMPHMQRLTWSGIALHGGRLPGHAASHGCIRLPYDFARELYAFTERGAQVIVADRETAPVAIAHPGLIRPTTRDEILGRKPAALQSNAAPVRTMQPASLVTLVAARSDRAAMPAQAPIAEDRSPAEMLGDIEAALGRLEAYRQRSDAPLRIVVTRWTDRERVVAIQRLLDELGYDPGPRDGQAGSRTVAAVRAYERASGLPVTGMMTDALVTSLAYVSGTSLGNGHLYVRQGGKPLLDAAVVIRDDGRPVGTHVYTAMDFGPDDGEARWTAITVSARLAGDSADPTLTALEALDAVAMPASLRTRLADLLTPGSTMIVTDRGVSNETLRGTDLIVEAR